MGIFLLQNEIKELNQRIFKPLSKYKDHSFPVKIRIYYNICHMCLHNDGESGAEFLKTDCITNTLVRIFDYSSLRHMLLLCIENTFIYLFVNN